MRKGSDTDSPLLLIKKIERSDSTLQHSLFDILQFCGSLF